MKNREESHTQKVFIKCFLFCNLNRFKFKKKKHPTKPIYKDQEHFQ